MSDLPKFLILLFVVLASAVIGRIAWEMVAPPVTELWSSVPSLLSALPGWVWWAAFGIVMSMICPLKIGFCRSRSSCRAS